MIDDESGPGFELIAAADSAVIVSVPHAGRAYPSGLVARLRAPPERLRALEDRHIDAIARDQGVTTLIATRPRLWIDLNRSETELDPEMVDPRPAPGKHLPSTKMRGGLGLIPRRLAGVGDIWRERLPILDVTRRIADHHRAYHDLIAQLLARARQRHGIAILIDLHSMPPLGAGAWPSPPRIVIGDRFGRSADARFPARLIAEAQAARLATSENRPYAGGYIIERHGRPRDNIHAIQVEIDRSLYLDPALAELDSRGLSVARALFRAMIEAIRDEALHLPSLAAE